MKVFSVSQINKIIKDLIDNEVILEDISVTGELSSFSVTRNIAYFTLKENDNLLSCVLFGAKQEFNIGDLVQCRGNIKYYPKGGKLSFQALTIEPCGQGELYKKFLELKTMLEQEGLFSEDNKIPLPRFINSIGVVTSKTGAVLQDIKNVTRRRNPNLDIYVYDAQVQGKHAVEQVIEGITYFDNMTDVDVIIVARGGGSLEDLMPFNDEKLARIAYICNKPLISAVGHETDFSILDFVCDLRAPTPSAAAELVTFDNREMIRYIKEVYSNINYQVEQNLINRKNQLDLITNSIEQYINATINDETIHVVDLINNIERKVENQATGTIYRVNMLLNTLDKLNPLKILKSGYAFITNNDQMISYENTNIGDSIDIVTSELKLTAEVKYKERK